jgi:hypothetical protein
MSAADKIRADFLALAMDFPSLASGKLLTWEWK